MKYGVPHKYLTSAVVKHINREKEDPSKTRKSIQNENIVDSALLSQFISSNEMCYTTYAPKNRLKRSFISK